MSPRKRVNFYLDDDLLEGLKALKRRERDVSESAAVRRAIAEFLERQGISVGKAERKRAPTRKRS